ncbi:MAG TPA: DUF2393 family protein [Acidobacteriaceae bacterium]|nr:DUF2393 family protein [Acidobacteriaceae bacterium]
MSPSGPQPGMFPSERSAVRDSRSPLPWIIAGVVVLAILGAIIAFTHQPPPANPGGANLAPPAPYAANLSISHLQMSQASDMVGGQNTYLDGQITNQGNKTVTGITVQAGFWGFTNQLVGKPTMPLALIRTREPYVDTEPVSAAPILPGQNRPFRLIFDSVPQDWNQNYPEIRIIQVTTE